MRGSSRRRSTRVLLKLQHEEQQGKATAARAAEATQALAEEDRGVVEFLVVAARHEETREAAGTATPRWTWRGRGRGLEANGGLVATRRSRRRGGGEEVREGHGEERWT